jgi:NNP family nitrate/nitrite transporter-like MFS transporter
MARTAADLYAIGLLLGIAGASFAVALPLASRWYPPEYQGLATGIAGAGNSGTLLTTLLAPRLAEHFGWSVTFGLAALPLVAVFVIFALVARDSPTRAAPSSRREYAAVLREPDTLWLSLLYGLTFGGFVGLASFLTVFFHEQYQVSRVAAGDFTTIVVVAGSLLRPVGGWHDDRLGMGLVTGIVGAAGGLGGFFLPSVLGVVKDATGAYTAGLVLFAAAFLAGAAMLLELGARWSRQWPAAAVRRAGVFAYRTPLRTVLGGDPA